MKIKLTIAFQLISLLSFANINLPNIFSNNMVLQQSSTVTFWGNAEPKESVEITPSWDTISYKTKADNAAKWKLEIRTPKAGGPYSITIKGYNQIEYTNVLIGEVWICSGQSNMDWKPSAGIDNATKEIATANYQNIRLFKVQHASTMYPQQNVNGSWSVCTPESMQDFSAIAYFFAETLQKHKDVPVGVINSSWGGSAIETWMPEATILNDSILALSAQKITKSEWSPNSPGSIYNAMIAPIVGYKVKGVLWYQGETNTANPDTYSQMLTTMITAWRDAWDEDLPFIFAQIAPFDYGDNTVGAEVQNQQRLVLRLFETAMIPTSDLVTDVKNIHPSHKRPVGERFAYAALVLAYGSNDYEYSGPLYRSRKMEKHKAWVYFDYADGLAFKNGDSSSFELAGRDRIFYPATAEIINGAVVVTCNQVKEPYYVRYAWSNTAQPKLVNKYNLPASVFSSE